MQPTVPASLLLGVHLGEAHRLPFFLLSSWGSPSLVPRLSAPIPSPALSYSSQSKPASPPGDFPVPLSWASESHWRASRVSLLSLGKASTVENIMPTWQKKSGQCDTRNLQHPSGDLSSNNTPKVLSHLHAMLQTSRNVFHPVVRPGDPAFHLLTRRTRSPGFLP